MSKKGISLLEVLVATVIFALIMIGLGNIFVAGRKYMLHARARMSGGQLGKNFLNPLHGQVRQDQWGSNCLSQDQLNGCTETKTIDNITYNVTYDINAVAGTNVRQVTAKINWVEISPTE